jgi:hypothetical protein
MKKNGSTNAKRQRREEHAEEDVEHAALRVDGADLDDLLAVFDRRLGRAFELDVRLDELHRAVRAGGHGLHRRAGEPVDHRAAGDQAEQEGRMQDRQLRYRRLVGQAPASAP